MNLPAIKLSAQEVFIENPCNVTAADTTKNHSNLKSNPSTNNSHIDTKLLPCSGITQIDASQKNKPNTYPRSKTYTYTNI